MDRIEPDEGLSATTGMEASRVVAALEEYQEILLARGRVDRERFLNEHPEVADGLAGYLEALDLLQWVGGDATPPWNSGAEPSPLCPGDSLGEYRILREVGRGGMGVVYEADQLSIPERRVALKVLFTAAALDPRTLARFRVETQAAACLNHSHIVPVYSAGCERGIPFYAMPLIQGRSLAQILAAVRAGDAAMPIASPAAGDSPRSTAPWPWVVARLGLQAAEALDHAHGLGIIHRDIKPSNLIVDPHGRLWVTDFGLARITSDDRGLTSSGDLIGTLRYMSPEQIRGEPGAGEARADIYALGVTLYEAITLHPVFGPSDRSALLHHILHDEPSSPRSIDPGIPKDLETIVMKAMDKVPTARYAGARDMAEDLRRFLEDRPILARRPGLLERLARWTGKHRVSLAVAIAGCILSMAVVTATLWRAKRQIEASMIELKEARRRSEVALTEAREAQTRSFVAFMSSIGIHDMITTPLLREAAASGSWDAARKAQSYPLLIRFYDEVIRTLSPARRHPEAVAQAHRRLGALQMELGDLRGLDAYERAIALYSSLAEKEPSRIWYRTDLIATLREQADHLDRGGDGRAASARRQACEVAEQLLATEAARSPCFSVPLIPHFEALAGWLARAAEARPADRALAVRLRTWVQEAPRPPAGTIYLPRP